MKERFYITTPIYYVNAKPHLGHAYTTIIADIVCRFNAAYGRETFFLTGTDEHGDKVVKAAQKENLEPKEYVDYISGLYSDLWPKLSIEYDQFIRTTYPKHKKTVKDILTKIYENKDIYFNEYEGDYCFGCERFYTKRELVDGKCPDHNIEPQRIKESNYFFKMSNYQDWLIDHIKNNPDFIRPKRYKNEVLAFLKEPLEDLCISRPKSRLTWGITLPFDNDYVTYVWFDALLNYVSALDYPDGGLFEKFWGSTQHIVAKDILKPHGIYWPIILKAAGIPLYKHLNVHGYWNVDENKMSKSIGNVIDPLALKKKYSTDAFRYFLAKEMAFGLDSSFSEEALIQRINSDLANDIGNLFSRTFSMAHKYFDGIVPKKMQGDPDTDYLREKASIAIAEYIDSMNLFAFHNALASVWKFIGDLNKYINDKAPWELAKDESLKKELASVICNLLESLIVISGLIYPVMPNTSATIRQALGFENLNKELLFDSLGSWNNATINTKLGKTVALFPRIKDNK